MCSIVKEPNDEVEDVIVSAISATEAPAWTVVLLEICKAVACVLEKCKY